MTSIAQQAVSELFEEPNAQPNPSIANSIAADAVDEIFAEPSDGGIKTEIDFEQQARDTLRETKGLAPKGEVIGFKPSFKAGFVKSPEKKAKIFSNALFPNEPDTIKRFGLSEVGEIVYEDKQGNIKSVNTVGAGTFTADAPVIAGQIGGGIAGGAVGRPFVGTVVGGSAGSVVKNAIGRMVLGDESIGLDDFVTDASIELVLGGISVAPAALATNNIKKKALADVADFNSKKTAQTIKRIKDSTGIDLDVAQASQLGSLRELRKWAFKFPNQAQNVMQAFRDLQSEQSQAAVNRILLSLAGESNTTALGQRGINAAKAAIEAAKLQRAKITQPLYQKAFESGEVVDINPLFTKVSQLHAKSSGKQKSVLKSVLSDLKDQKGNLKNDIERLHNVKLSIDDLLERRVQNAIGLNTQRALAEIKNDLVDTLANASGEYDIARNIFSELSENIVTPLDNSILGVLANVKNKKAATVSAELLTAKNADPKQVRFLKSALKREDPEAFNSVVRQFVANNLDTALKELQNSGTANVEGKLTQSLFGTPKQQQAMLAAFDGDAKLLFKDVMEAFKLIKDAGVVGSDTAFNQQQANRIVSSFPSIRRFLLQPRASIAENIEQNFIDRNAVLIAKALTDPERVKELKQLRNISGKTEAGLAILSNIIVQQGLEATGRELGIAEEK